MKNSRLIFSLIFGLIVFSFVLNRFFPCKAEVFRQTPIQVASTALYRDFKNEAEANKKYSGKLLEVNGVIKQTGEGATGQPFVILNGGDSLGEVRCILSREDPKKARELKPGQTVTLQGVCMGKVINVTLDECKL